ncbi:MAG: hypothetical protein IJK71_03645 [Clostridia bacterium]|nr:hypothetical protein [Clostridia bacterium]
MDIQRIDNYTDTRFSKTVLEQHGAYLIDNDPYEIKITGPAEATVRGKDPSVYAELIEEFRFHAPHITRFFDEAGSLLAEYPVPEIIEVEIDRIQPSQFFVDEEKLAAIRSFIHQPEDVTIQVLPWNDRFISLDGHTRLYAAVQEGFPSVKAVISETNEWVWPFVLEAEKRKIFSPRDLILLSHDDYEVQWNQYCDSVFAQQDPNADG